MPKLRIQAPDGKTLVVDVTGYQPDQYDDLAAAAVEDYTAQHAHPYGDLPDEVRNEAGLEDATVSTLKNAGTATKAGIAGLSDVAVGNGLEQASTDVQHVLNNEAPETKAGKTGSVIGGLATPEQIILQEGLGAFLEGSGIGEWAASIMKDWGEKAAVAAVGNVKALAKAMGIDNLGELARFLLNPVKIGSQEFAPIVSATSTVTQMKAAAEAIQAAAGKALEKINPVIDEALSAHPEHIDLKAILESLDKMKLAVSETAPNLGKAVVNQYTAAIDDFLNVVQKSTLEDNPQLFTDLRNLKTTIGDLVYRHGSPLESKAALEDAYAALSRGIDAAAEAADPAIGEAFAEANNVYNKITSVVEGLNGKAIAQAAKGFWGSSLPAIGMGILAGFANPAAAIPTAAAVRAAEAYGPQAIAQGLNAGSKFITPALQASLRSLPIAGGIMMGLSDNNQ